MPFEATNTLFSRLKLFPRFLIIIIFCVPVLSNPTFGQSAEQENREETRLPVYEQQNEISTRAGKSQPRNALKQISQQNEALSIVNSAGDTLMQVETDGKVGIGTTNPNSALEVNGTLSADFFVGNGANLTNLPDNSPWNNSGSNIYFNTGKVGIGDNSPLATFTVGNGDKLQIHGSDGDVVFKDDQGSIRFANSNGSNAPMMHMFTSGTNNSTRMLVAHSPNFTRWGIQYNDTSDAFNYIGDNLPVLQVQLGGLRRIGIGTFSPQSKVHIFNNSTTGFGHLKLTEEQLDYSRITFNNTIHSPFWDIAARCDTNLAIGQLNFYYSGVGDIVSVNARRRVGINDASPGWPLEVNGNGQRRAVNVYNTLPTTSTSSFNYGVIANLGQASHNGFPRLYNIYGFSNDSDSYLSYGVYGFASNASNFNYGVYGVAATTTGYAVYGSGNIYATGQYLPSDRKLKRLNRSYSEGLQTVMDLRPTRYEYDRNNYDFMNLPEGEQYGFIADEVRDVLPNLVKRSFQGYDEPTSDTHEGQGVEFDAVNYTSLIPILVSAVQEQQAQIEALQKRIQELEKR